MPIVAVSSHELFIILTVDLNLRLNPPRLGGFLALSTKTYASGRGTAIHSLSAFRTFFRTVTGAMSRRLLNTLTHLLEMYHELCQAFKRQY
jgi:hypothetical protein